MMANVGWVYIIGSYLYEKLFDGTSGKTWTEVRNLEKEAEKDPEAALKRRTEIVALNRIALDIPEPKPN